MTPHVSCPRCQTVVPYADGTRPTCPTCGYPGLDVRIQQPAWTPPGPGPGPAGPTRTSGKAVAALVLGISGFLLPFLGLLLGLAAIVLGVLARREVQAGGGAVEGDGMAVAGIVLGAITLLFGAIIFAAVLFVLVADVGEGAEVALALLGP